MNQLSYDYNNLHVAVNKPYFSYIGRISQNLRDLSKVLFFTLRNTFHKKSLFLSVGTKFQFDSNFLL